VRLFVLALAVADDFLSLIAIGIFYSGKLNLATSASTILAAVIGALLPKKELVIKYLTPWSFYVVTPVVIITHFPTHLEFNGTVSSYLVARIVGKVLGIAIVGWLILRKELIGIGLLCGMGMTVSIVIAEISATGAELDSIHSGIYLASIISGILGYLWFRVKA
jgi:NhaA family Na+:H+ antiporter